MSMLYDKMSKITRQKKAFSAVTELPVNAYTKRTMNENDFLHPSETA